MQDSAFKDTHREFRLFFIRISVALGVMFVMLMILLWRYYYLQILHHDRYATRSESNRVHVRPVSPTRGLIYDRNGVLLADNKAGFNLSIVVERSPDLNALLEDLDALLDLQEEELKRFERQKSRRKPYEPVPLRINLSEQEQSVLAVNEYRLEGVEITAQLVRHYPHGSLLSHVLGYVGRINEQELEVLDPVRYSGTYVIGKTGIENSYEDTLLGEVGYEYVETNARGRVMRMLERIAPAVGKDIYLHLDIRLQEIAYEALGDHLGAVVMMDVRTGGVLAMVSKPGFDNNLFVTGISVKDYNELLNSPDRPLFDRVTQGQYPPGSTIKPAFGLAALETGVMAMDSVIYDPGFFRLPNHDHKYRDWKRGGHGRVDLHTAIVQSCDTYFYSAGVKMGIDELYYFGTRFGFGEKTGIDLPSERAGLMPSRDWKRGVRGVPWYPGDTVNTSIGQGFMLSTPLQLAVLATRLAARGDMIVPRMVKSVANNGGDGDPPVSLGRIQGSEEHWDYVIDAMKDVVHGARGTAKGIARGLDYTIAGKTGTAQVVGIRQGETYNAAALSKRNRDHALFIAFAPVDEPQVAIGVIAENGEHGSSTAAPMARAVFDAYMKLSEADGHETPAQ
ncbi:MAG: penicillin-binding protein 2 [Porticoccaceae bacterium]